MKKQINKFFLLIISIALFLVAIVSEKSILHSNSTSINIESFQETLNKKQKGLNKLLDDFINYPKNYQKIKSLYKNKGIIILRYDLFREN